MTVHQRFGPPAYEFHPELGYLCPSRQLRQNVRVGLAAAAFGLITGMAGAIALLPRHDGDPARSKTLLAAEPPGPVRGSTPLMASSPSIGSPEAPLGAGERVSTDRIVNKLPISPAVGAANE